MKKMKNILSAQFEQLKEKVIRGADRLGLDLTEIGSIERLLTISNGASDSDGSQNEAWESASWTERIFAIAFRCSADDHHGDADDELIESLCLGNWAIGFIDGLPGEKPAAEVCVSCLIKQHSSAIGKIGGIKRHAANVKLREWSIEQYRAGTWKSANKAAYDLKEKVMAHGRTIGAHLTEENAQDTIAKWINAWLKESAPSR